MSSYSPTAQGAGASTVTIWGRRRVGGVSRCRHGAEEAALETNVDHIVVEPRPDGRWARQRNGPKRAASLHAPQTEAEAAARAQAKRMHTELVIKGANGQILRRDRYGGDPARRPG